MSAMCPEEVKKIPVVPIKERHEARRDPESHIEGCKTCHGTGELWGYGYGNGYGERVMVAKACPSCQMRDRPW